MVKSAAANMIKDTEFALLRLILETEKHAKTLPKSKERAALIKASYEARQHLPNPHPSADQIGRNAAKHASRRVQSLMEASSKYLTSPMTQDEIEDIAARETPPPNVIELFPRKKAEDPIARAVRVSQQLRKR